MRALLAMLIAGCAPLIDVSVDSQAAWIALVVIEDGSLILSTGIMPVEESIYVDDDRALLIAWSEADLAELDLDVHASSEPLRIARPCQLMLPPPSFVYALDGRSIDPSTLPRFTARWLDARCPCVDRVEPSDFTVRSVEIPDSVERRVVAAAAASETSVLVQLDDHSTYLVDPHRALQHSLPALRDLHVASSTTWLVEESGEVTAIFGDHRSVMDVAPGGMIVGPPPWSSDSSTWLAADGRVRELDGERAIACSTERFRPIDKAWLSPDDFAFLFADATLCRIREGRAEMLRLDPELSFFTAPFALHPELGVVFASDDGDLHTLEPDGAPALHRRTEHQTTSRYVCDLEAWGSGVLIGDEFGELAWFSPQIGEILIEHILTMPQRIIPVRRGFAVIAQHVASEFRWERNDTNVVVWFFERRDCSM